MRADYKGFSALIYDRTGLAINSDSIELQPVFFSKSAQGGSNRAEIVVVGQSPGVWDIMNWLGYKLVIKNKNGNTVWAGIICEATVNRGVQQVGMSLEKMANRVRCIYNQNQPDGSSTQEYTEWAEEAESIRRYGAKEYVSSLTDSNLDAANNKRDTTLSNRKYPQAIVSFDGDGQAGGRIVGLGRWNLQAWYYYTNLAGREVFEPATDIDHVMGFQLISNTFGFRYEAIHEQHSNLRWFKSENRIRVTGSPWVENNGTFTVSSVGDRKEFAYQADTISFDPNDDILDTAGGLGDFESDQMIIVSGAVETANNGARWVKTTGRSRIEATNGFFNIVQEDAGSPITITMGDKMDLGKNVHAEVPGELLNVTGIGVKVAQRFTTTESVSWAAKEVAVTIGSVGSPTDEVRISIYTDDGGYPGVQLATGTVAASKIKESSDWVSVVLDVPITMTFGTYYQIVVERTGGYSYKDFYTVGLASGVPYAPGEVMLFDAGTNGWGYRYETAYMPFQVWGRKDTLLQAYKMLVDSPWLTGAVYEGTSGLDDREYRVGDQKTLDEIQKMLDMGTSAKKKVLADVDEEGVARLYIEPLPSKIDPIILPNGDLQDPISGEWEEGVLPVGRYVQLSDIPVRVGLMEQINPILVKEAEYDVENRKTKITPWGMEDEEDF